MYSSQFPLLFICIGICVWIEKSQSDEFENLDVLMNEHLRPDEPQIPTSGPVHFNAFGQRDFDLDHEVVLGSFEQTQYFKQLEPEEAKTRLGQLFEKMDANQNGNLDKNELIDWIVQSFTNLDLESAKIKLNDYDADQDGTLTWEEYTTRVYGYSSTELEQLAKDSSNETQAFLRSIEEEKIKFKSADLDQNGHLNATEFTAFEHPHNYPHMAPYEIIHTLRDFDTDNDGFISQQEYLADDKMHREAFKIELENFKRYDTNGDGRLDQEEMKHWVTPGFQRTATEEAEHLFSETDANGDKELSKEEVLAQHELWVGSQATDYGRHLEHSIRDEL
ncbi:hypothetical protein T265_04760 [Opisthorchis viverrini]|uniref:Reticulocalbin-3 n=2 Tax=Opisthorchis viverrini TaxID=6198 RepID=A0A074ZLX5_OPIVI|nr:hypothetical protein T265_04760 [Opisthorchis viverrini]KER28373.1 hypothetical protein T265_04760 [Opisthorchis viverrini]